MIAGVGDVPGAVASGDGMLTFLYENELGCHLFGFLEPTRAVEGIYVTNGRADRALHFGVMLLNEFSNDERE
jgi:hypothetical protein